MHGQGVCMEPAEIEAIQDSLQPSGKAPGPPRLLGGARPRRFRRPEGLAVLRESGRRQGRLSHGTPSRQLPPSGETLAQPISDLPRWRPFGKRGLLGRPGCRCEEAEQVSLARLGWPSRAGALEEEVGCVWRGSFLFLPPPRPWLEVNPGESERPGHTDRRGAVGRARAQSRAGERQGSRCRPRPSALLCGLRSLLLADATRGRRRDVPPPHSELRKPQGCGERQGRGQTLRRPSALPSLHVLSSPFSVSPWHISRPPLSLCCVLLCCFPIVVHTFSLSFST